jgi:hypothetical protein
MACWFDTIERIFKRRLAADGRSKKSDDPMGVLKDSYRDLARLAAQVTNHAARAPYPGVAERLRRIAQEKQAGAELVRAKLIAAHQNLDEAALEVNSGGNHWERMSQDLYDHTVLETRLLERAALIEEKTPEYAELLRGIAQSHSRHVRAFMDMIARADPQAQQT